MQNRAALAVAILVGCDGGGLGGGGQSTWLDGCETTTSTVPESCGEAEPIDGRFDQVAIVDGAGFSVAAGLDAGGRWHWIYSGLSIPVSHDDEFGPWAAIDGGLETMCGVLRDGSAVCFDLRHSGGPLFDHEPLGDGAFSEVQVGDQTVCGLGADEGEVHCAGPTPEPSGSFLALSHQRDDWVAVRADGELQALAGAATLPSGPFVDVAGGGVSGCGQRDDGELACWGALAEDVPTGPFASVVAADVDLACALRVDGSAACWGPDRTICDEPELGGPFASLVLGGVRCGVQLDGTAVCLPYHYEPYVASHSCEE